MSPDRLGIQNGVPAIVEGATVEPFFLPSWVEDLKSQNYLPGKLVIAEPLSYCAGVVRANEGIDEMLDQHSGETVYLYHAPIHNDTKLSEWETKNARVVNSLDEVPNGSPVYFSAHGLAPEVWDQARKKGLRGKDATCPLVEKGHREVRDLKDQGYTILLVGHKSHDEILGTIGEAPEDIVIVNPHSTREQIDELMESLKDTERVALRSQTTLAVSDLSDLIDYIKDKRPDLNLPKVSDICYATENRQEAIVQAIISGGAQVMIIFGSNETKRQPSSNSIRLREVAESHGIPAYLVEDIGEIKSEWFRDVETIGLSAGASADPKRVAEFLDLMRSIGVKNDQIQRITVAQEPQVFAPARDFDFRT